MPLEHRTRALVLRTFDQGESDRVVRLYTESLGRVSAIAKGARRSKRRFPGTLELFTVVDVRLVEPPRASLLRLESAKLVRSFEGLTRSLGRFAIACLFIELLDRLAPERSPQPELFRFSLGVLEVIDSETPDRLLATLVIAKTIARLGFRPQLAACAVCGAEITFDGGPVAFLPAQGGSVCPRCAPPEEARIAARLPRALEAGLRLPLRARAELGLSSGEVAAIEHLVDRFYRFHIGVELRAGGFLRETLTVDGAESAGDTASASPDERVPPTRPLI